MEVANKSMSWEQEYDDGDYVAAKGKIGKAGKNKLLMRAAVGRTAPTSMKLPADDYAYGHTVSSSESAKSVIFSWPDDEREKRLQTKEIVVSRGQTQHKTHKKPGRGATPRPVPKDDRGFGAPAVKNEESMGDVVTFAFGRAAVRQQREAQKQEKQQVKKQGKFVPKATKTSDLRLKDLERKRMLALAASAEKDKEEERAKLPAQYTFKMKRFQNVPSKITQFIGGRKQKTAPAQAPEAQAEATPQEAAPAANDENAENQPE